MRNEIGDGRPYIIASLVFMRDYLVRRGNISQAVEYFGQVFDLSVKLKGRGHVETKAIEEVLNGARGQLNRRG